MDDSKAPRGRLTNYQRVGQSSGAHSKGQVRARHQPLLVQRHRFGVECIQLVVLSMCIVHHAFD
jgi:hypothetical protein